MKLISLTGVDNNPAYAL